MGVGVWLGVVSLVRGRCNTCSVCLPSLLVAPLHAKKETAPLPHNPGLPQVRERPPTERDREAALRCRHGHTTNTLSAQARERRRWAASLVAVAVFGRAAKRVLLLLLLAFHAAREKRRARRGTVAPCGCAPVHVKACVLACGR